MIKPLKWMALALCLAFAACSSDPATFLSYAEKSPASSGADANTVRKRSDAVALNYANSVEEIFRARATGARYTREASATALAGLTIFTGAAKTLDIGAAKLVKMGMLGSGIIQLQTIFDAKARSTAYSEAAERIHSAIKDYGAYNLNDVSEQYLTPNGWTLVNVVQSNIDIVSKILGGHLPSPEALEQASEPMSPEGATLQGAGVRPPNNIPSNREAAVAARVERAIARAVRNPSVVSVEEFKRIKEERDRLLANKPRDIDFSKEAFAVEDDARLTDAQKQIIFEDTVKGAGLAETVDANASSLVTYFQDTATPEQKTALANALVNAKKKPKP